MAADTYDLISLVEAYQAINDPTSATAGTGAHDDVFEQWITGISQRVVALCGDVVNRTYTDEAYDGGEAVIALRHTPVSSVTSVTEYSGTVSQALTAETNASKPNHGYQLVTNGKHLAELHRRSGDADGRFAAGRGNVVVTYVSGRAATTATVPPKFKLAAASILRRLWHREGAAWALGGNPFEAAGTGSVGFFRAVDPIIEEFLADEMSVA